MSILSNSERCKLKTLLGKCLENGKLNSDMVDIFIEIAVRKGWDLCEYHNRHVWQGREEAGKEGHREPELGDGAYQ